MVVGLAGCLVSVKVGLVLARRHFCQGHCWGVGVVRCFAGGQRSVWDSHKTSHTPDGFVVRKSASKCFVRTGAWRLIGLGWIEGVVVVISTEKLNLSRQELNTHVHIISPIFDVQFAVSDQ